MPGKGQEKKQFIAVSREGLINKLEDIKNKETAAKKDKEITKLQVHLARGKGCDADRALHD